VGDEKAEYRMKDEDTAAAEMLMMVSYCPQQQQQQQQVTDAAVMRNTVATAARPAAGISISCRSELRPSHLAVT